MPDCVIGLGNPGAEYDATRHNAGFWFVDALAAQEQAAFSFKSRFRGRLAMTPAKMVLLKPETFMNNSGEAARAVLSFYRLETARLLVVYDEVDLPPGVAKLKFGGGSAGHRGVADVSRCVGEQYWRLRIGVGKPAVGGVTDYVLQAPPAEERAKINAAMSRSLAVWGHIAAGDYNTAMKNLHTDNSPPPVMDAGRDGS